jgi:regulator of sirC expression with transglutaminase-like and TPR domain
MISCHAATQRPVTLLRSVARVRRAWRRPCVAGIFFACATLAGHTATGDDGFLDRLLATETQCDAICTPPDAAARAGEEIQAAAAALRADPAMAAGGPGRIRVLNRYVFDELGIRASDDLDDPASLLLASVVRDKKGYCVGVASLYLALARALGVQIDAVATPAHVFLRYDDGSTRVNIETLRGGAAVSDDDYIREHRIAPGSIAAGVFLRNLTDDEFFAQVHNNLGVIYSRRGDYERAAAQYETARRLDKRFPAALYNQANDRLAQGALREAIRLYARSLRLDPADAWALNNRGLAYLRSGRPGKARRDFEAALRVSPDFAAARANLERLDAGYR